MGKDVQPLQSVKTSILAVLTVKSGLGILALRVMILVVLKYSLFIV